MEKYGPSSKVAGALGRIYLENEDYDLGTYRDEDIKLNADLNVRDAELPLLPLRGDEVE